MLLRDGESKISIFRILVDSEKALNVSLLLHLFLSDSLSFLSFSLSISFLLYYILFSLAFFSTYTSLPLVLSFLVFIFHYLSLALLPDQAFYQHRCHWKQQNSFFRRKIDRAHQHQTKPFTHFFHLDDDFRWCLQLGFEVFFSLMSLSLIRERAGIAFGDDVSRWRSAWKLTLDTFSSYRFLGQCNRLLVGYLFPDSLNRVKYHVRLLPY